MCDCDLVCDTSDTFHMGSHLGNKTMAFPLFPMRPHVVKTVVVAGSDANFRRRLVQHLELTPASASAIWHQHNTANHVTRHHTLNSQTNFPALVAASDLAWTQPYETFCRVFPQVSNNFLPGAQMFLLFLLPLIVLARAAYELKAMLI